MRVQLSKLMAAIILLSSSIFTLTYPLANQAFAATTYTFTNAGATGMYGPTQAQVNSAYSNTTLNGQVVVSGSGVQEWSPPLSGQYQINIYGAAGGGGKIGSGGSGAYLQIRVSLNAGETLSIVVGQKGADSNTAAAYPGGAGGGGSFIYKNSDNSYIAVAGGGGGGAGASAALFTSQTTANGKYDTTTGSTVNISGGYIALGGVGGEGGGKSNRINYYGGPGAGINSDGVYSYSGQGKSRINGWWGGWASLCMYPSKGGFGGGGGAGCDSATYNSFGWAGGGGGYSGGAAGGNGGNGDSQYGGGGGSYYTGTLITGQSGNNSGHGLVQFITVDPTATTNSISITGNPISGEYNKPLTVTANVSNAGKVTFTENGRKIAGCIAKIALTSASCTWKPRIRGSVQIKATLIPTDNAYASSTSSPVNIAIIARSTPR